MDERQDLVGCSLSAPELVERRTAWNDVEPALVDRVRTAGGFRMRFRRDPGVAESLRVFVDAEGDCCGWASWEVADDGDHAVLRVTGPPERIAPLADAFGL